MLSEWTLFQLVNWTEVFHGSGENSRMDLGRTENPHGSLEIARQHALINVKELGQRPNHVTCEGLFSCKYFGYR